MWRLFCHYLFLIYPSFSVSGRLCFLIVVYPGYLHRYFNIGIKHGFSCINIRQVPWEVLKTEAGGRGFQHLPRDLAIVNALKNHVRLLLRGSCKKVCHWVRITSVLRFIKHIFIINFQSIPPLLKHIFVTFLPSREKQINSPLLVSVRDTDK